MKQWERAIELEREGKGIRKTTVGEIDKNIILRIGCPGMYSDMRLLDFKYEGGSCQGYTYEHGYTPCQKCWEQEYIPLTFDEAVTLLEAAEAKLNDGKTSFNYYWDVWEMFDRVAQEHINNLKRKRDRLQEKIIEWQSTKGEFRDD